MKKLLFVLCFMIVGCGGDNLSKKKAVSIGGVFYFDRVEAKIDGVNKEISEEEEVELPLGGYLKLYLPCDYPNLYTWELARPYPQHYNGSNDFRMDEMRVTNKFGREVPTQIWGFLARKSQTIELFYYKRNVWDNLAPPDQVLKRFSVKVKVDENKSPYEKR